MKNINEQLDIEDGFSDMLTSDGKTVKEEVAVLRDEAALAIHKLREQRDFKNESADELEKEAKKPSAVLLGYLRDVEDPEHPNSLISQAKENRVEAGKIKEQTRKKLKELKKAIEKNQELLITRALDNSLSDPLFKISDALRNLHDQGLLDIGISGASEISTEELSTALNSHFRYRNKFLSNDMLDRLANLQDYIREVKTHSGPHFVAKPLIERTEKIITESTEMALVQNPNFFEQNGNRGLSLLKGFKVERSKRIVQIVDETVSDDTLNMLFKGGNDDLSTIDTLLKLGSEKMKRVVEATIETYINEGNGNLYRLTSKQLELPYAKDLILHKVGDYVSAQYDIKDGYKLVKRWETSASLAVETNLSTLKYLEKLKPGAVKLLHEEYGICEFGRYPYEMLVDQVESHDKDIPYGVLVYPSSDENNAFDQDYDVLRKLYDGTKGKHINRIFEINTRTDFARALVTLDLKYDTKIDYMIFAAHGSKDRIDFGHAFRQGYLSTKSLEDSKSLDRVKRMFSPNPQIVLFSCHTGKENGIAQVVSDKLNATVIAPTIATNPTDIKVNYENGKPKFKVTYDALPHEHAVHTMGIKSEQI